MQGRAVALSLQENDENKIKDEIFDPITLDELKGEDVSLSPPVNFFYLPFQGGASFVDHLCYFCLVFVMLSCASVY